MRTDGHDSSRFVGRPALPAIDHEANGPISMLVRAVSWATRAWRDRADQARAQLMLQTSRWL